MAISDLRSRDLNKTVSELDDAYNNLLDTSDLYESEWRAIHSLLPPPIKSDGVLGRIELTEEQYFSLRHKFAALNHLMENLVNLASQTVDQAYGALVNIAESPSKLKGRRFDVELASPTGEIKFYKLPRWYNWLSSALTRLAPRAPTA